MTDSEKKAWEILTAPEQMAISLKLGYNKSSWESGEIIGKAHYKFLEIEARAKRFMQIFTQHFETCDVLIPKDVDIHPSVKKYLENSILKRKKAADALKNLVGMQVPIARIDLLEKTLKMLLNSESEFEKNLGALILEFDRWNNFRILPRELQEPSAYKRRNKNYEIRNIRNLLSIKPFAIKMILRQYEQTDPTALFLYMPVFSGNVLQNKQVVKVKYTEKSVLELSRIGLYLFPKLDKATQFMDIVAHYDMKKRGKSCKFGQKFWPQFRELTLNSVNYNLIQKRVPSRKFLENTLQDISRKIDPEYQKDQKFVGLIKKSKKMRKAKSTG